MLLYDVKGRQYLNRVGYEGIHADAEQNEGHEAVYGLEVQGEDGVCLVSVNVVCKGSEYHKKAHDSGDGRPKDSVELVWMSRF